MSENNTETTASEQPRSMQDIASMFADFDRRLGEAREVLQTADSLLDARREEHAASIREAQSLAKERVDAVRREEDAKIAELSDSHAKERSSLVEEANHALDEYKAIYKDALDTGVITKQALALGGHTLPKGKRRA